MNGDNYTQLTLSDILEERPFTHPDHVSAELAILRSMVQSLCQTMEQLQSISPESRPIIQFHPEPHGRMQRIVLNRPKKLLRRNQLVVVGFFGQKRGDVEMLPLRNRLDKELIGEFPQHRDLLSYSTLEFLNGNFGNLILFTNEQAKSQWRVSRAHAEAVETLAPRYYRSVRLYNGILPGGILASETLHLTRVMYYDYEEMPPWLGLRAISEYA